MFGILHLQSSYSMLKNTIPIDILLDKVKQGGYDFIALSDVNMHAMVSMFKGAEKRGIKPVLGLKINVFFNLTKTGFLVYVKNEVGYQNILDVLRKKDNKDFSIEDLKKHQEGLIFVSSGQDSIINQAILNEDINSAKTAIKLFDRVFDEFFLGLSLDTFNLEMKVAPIIYELSEKTKVKMLPLHQTSYEDKNDRDVYEALIKIDDEKNEITQDENYEFKSKEKLKEMFFDYLFVFESLSNMIKSITFEWRPPKFKMPLFPVKKGTSGDNLRALSIMGLKKRLKNIPSPDYKTYQNRLLYELSIIKKMGFDDYFLIVYDFVKYAKTQKILVGPGRGSAAGSLVAYCLGITDVDPITYDLLFERFLNPERISMPDIDMDFPDNKRDIVLNYVKEKYGENHIISITTFGKFAVRSSIRDIARVMKIEPSRVKGIIQSVVDNNIDQSDYEMMRLLQVAKKIEGLPRYSGTHAAGIIMAQQDLTKYLPLHVAANGFYQSQLDQGDLESLGLLKVDFLGIRNLSVIDDTVKSINKLGDEFILSNLRLDDLKTYELLSRALTNGIFQVESRGMRATLKKLQPNCFEDIVAILALYRPGPMESIDEYIARRNGKNFSYIHPELKKILKPTYGIIIYQEQIMRIASEFAGYSLAEADLLRRGISKKDKTILDQERNKFTQKCEQKGHSPTVSKLIYDYIVKFADYGFNRSHSVAYSLITYQMSYLKANYFPHFMTTLLTNSIGNHETIKQYVLEIKRNNTEVVAPNINRSTDAYIYLNGAIYPSLLSVKSIGKLIVDKIMSERLSGEFKSFEDLKFRLREHLNDKNMEMLIHSGALDTFGLNHKTMIYHMSIEQSGFENYIDDFKLAIKDDYTFGEKVELEKEALGYNIVYDPLDAYRSLIATRNLDSLADLQTKPNGIVLAAIKNVTVIKTKQGNDMAFIELDDGVSELNATLFSNGYEEYKAILKKDIYIFKLKENIYKKKKTFIIEFIEVAEEK